MERERSRGQTARANERIGLRRHGHSQRPQGFEPPVRLRIRVRASQNKPTHTGESSQRDHASSVLVLAVSSGHERGRAHPKHRKRHPEQSIGPLFRLLPAQGHQSDPMAHLLDTQGRHTERSAQSTKVLRVGLCARRVAPSNGVRVRLGLGLFDESTREQVDRRDYDGANER